MPLPPSDFKMPPLACEMCHFPKSKADALKQQLSTSVVDGWISTYDVTMAFLWSRITRAKLDLLKPDENMKAITINDVDARKAWSPPLPERSLSVHSYAALCDPLTIRDIIAPDNLAKLATSVRASIKASTPEHFTGALQWIASRDDKRWLEVDVKCFLGMDLGASSWARMTAYEKQNFGFGCPRALRWPSPPFDGFIWVYPSRAAQKNPEHDEGVEVCVYLEESSIERLMKDELLLKYAHVRGL